MNLNRLFKAHTDCAGRIFKKLKMLWTLTAVISDEDYTQRFAVCNLFASSGGNPKRNYTHTHTNKLPGSFKRQT